jgi:glutamate 5-kinase
MNKTVVIKIGSSLVTDRNDSIDKGFIRSISSQIRKLIEKGLKL